MDYIRLFCALVGAVIAPLNSQAQVDMLTYHNDNARTGQNLNETKLTLANVNTNTFGLLFNCPVDGIIYAQPLYMAGVAITNQGIHNVVFVATSHDSVYAFDADSNAAPLWQVSFIDPSAGVTTLLPADVNGCSNPPEIGITGTPVIDPTSQTLYVEATTRETNGANLNYVHRLHALDVGSGAEKFGGPVKIQPVVPGTGDGSDGKGHVPFDGQTQFNRAALLLEDGAVYVSYSSHCDRSAYHGWIVGFNAETLQLQGIFNDTPNGGQGGIWSSGGGPAADINGNLYVMTANGTFDGATNNDYGDSIVKLTPNGTNLELMDFFCPADQLFLQQGDWDVGSGGLVVLPDEVGTPLHPHLAVGGTKYYEIYLVDRDNMGGFDALGNDIVQDLPYSIGNCFSIPAYFNETLYFINTSASIETFPFVNGLLPPTPASSGSNIFPFPGATPSVSANGTNNGIIWAVSWAGALYAYDATNVATELYDTQQNSSRDTLSSPAEFAVPTVVNGKVYVNAWGWLYVYGLLSPYPRLEATAAGQQIVLTWTSNSNYSLEVATDLTPPITWMEVPQDPVVTGNQSSVTIPMGSAPAFYRLKGSQ